LQYYVSDKGWIPRKTPGAYRSVLDNVFRTYNQAGFWITIMHCENEFRPLMDQLKNTYNVQMNYANSLEHVPEAERNNCLLKSDSDRHFTDCNSKIFQKSLSKYSLWNAQRTKFFPTSQRNLTILFPSNDYASESLRSRKTLKQFLLVHMYKLTLSQTKKIPRTQVH
jgi:hypothetical protein